MTLCPTVAPGVLLSSKRPPFPGFDFTLLFYYFEIFALNSQEDDHGSSFDLFGVVVHEYTFPEHQIVFLTALMAFFLLESDFFLTFSDASFDQVLPGLEVTAWQDPFVSETHVLMSLGR